VSGAFSTHGGKEKCVQGFGGKPEREGFEDLGSGGIIMLEEI
jgi:hypothetical protein